jgi:hypothetical protein
VKYGGPEESATPAFSALLYLVAVNPQTGRIVMGKLLEADFDPPIRDFAMDGTYHYSPDGVSLAGGVSIIKIAQMSLILSYTEPRGIGHDCTGIHR